MTREVEDALRRAQRRLVAAEAAAHNLRGDRNALINRLVAEGYRVVDIAQVLGISTKAVRDGRDRHQGKPAE